MSAVYRFFRSVRLAVTLLLTLTVLSILSTLIPQGQPPSFYGDRYPPGLASLILALGFNRFFTSGLFLAPTGLFVANLATCTVHRLVTRARTGAPRRHGPDLVHVGLLVLAVGGITTALVRRERYFTMAVGDAVEVTGGYVVELLDFQFHRYDTGRPRDWVSTVRVNREGSVLLDAYDVEVNRPLRLGLLRIYQTSYDTDGVLRLAAPGGEIHVLHRGDGIPGDPGIVRYLVGFERADSGAYLAVFQDYRGNEPVGVSRRAANQTLGAYRIEGVEAWDLTGLTAARDPGYIPVLAALVLGVAGMTLTFTQGRKDRPE